MKILLLLLLISNTCLAGTSFKKKSDAIYTATGTSTQVISRDLDRKYLLIQNQGTDIVIINLASAQSGGNGIQIPAGGFWEPLVCPYDSIFIKALSGTQAVEILEGK